MANTAAAAAIIELLHEAAGVTTLIGSGDSFRCYPGRIPHGDAFPAIKWQTLGTVFERHLIGTAGYATTNMLIDCIGTTYDDAKDLADAVLAALDEKTTDKLSIRIDHIEADEEAYGFYLDPSGTDTTHRHQVTVGVLAYHGPAIVASLFPKLSDVVAYWKLDETSGNRADATGNGHTLTPTGSFVVVDGQRNYAIDSEASAAIYLGTTDVDDFRPGANPFSVQAWVQLDALTAAGQFIGNWTSSGNLRGWSLLGDTGPTMGFRLSPDGVNVYTANSNGTPSFSPAWHHYVGVYTGSKIKLYQDGVLQTDEVTYSSGVFANCTPLRVSSYPSGSAVNARIDELCYWSNALTQADVTLLYNAGNGLPYPS